MKPRGKPFSGKQKKEQLKEKRAAKHQHDDSDDDGGSKPKPSAYVSRGDATTATLSADKGGIRSQFVADSRRELEERKLQTLRPITQRRGDPRIPIEEWFALPGLGAARTGPLRSDAAGGAMAPLAIELPTPPTDAAGGGGGGLAPARPQSSHPGRRQQQQHQQQGGRGRGKGAAKGGKGPLKPQGANPAESDSDSEQPEPTARQAAAATFVAARDARFDRWCAAVEATGAAQQAALGDINQYERNPQVWVQLWHTVRHSDVALLICDARYPIFHLCLSVVHYIVVRSRKPLLVVLNKKDLVPATELQHWIESLSLVCTEFLRSQGIALSAPQGPAEEGATASSPLDAYVRFLPVSCAPDKFLSAAAVGGAGRGKKNAAVAQGLKRKEVKNRSRKVIGRGGADSDDDVGARNRSKVRNELDAGYAAALGAKSDTDEDEGEEEADEEEEDASEEASDDSSSERGSTMAPTKQQQQQKHKRQYYAATENFKGQARAEAMLDEDAVYRAAQAAAKEDTSRSIDALLATARALVVSFAAAHGVPPPQPTASSSSGEQQPAVIHMGFIGFPNVGKSTILNAVCGVKRVSVSSTPGHTKHVQTIVLPEDHVVLLDCPGLCFPAVGVPRPLQAVLGTHQIAQTRDPQSGVAYIARHLPLERVYGLRKIDADGSADDNVWSAVDLCESFAVKKGYRIRNAKGRPDVHRAAISILQDAYEGRLVLYFAAPPLESGWAARFARGGFAPIPEEVLEPTDATPAEYDM